MEDKNKSLKCTIIDAVLRMMEMSGRKKAYLNERMGWSKSGMYQMLSRGNMQADTLAKLAEAMDYKVVLMPKKESGRYPDGSIILEIQKEESKK